MPSLSSLLGPLLTLPSLLVAHPHSRAALPPHWLLAGDSTTAPNGGWGVAFISTTLSNGATGTNWSRSGATTLSFRGANRWANLTSEAEAWSGNSTVYVTIQFGHNDQKEGSGVNTTQFQTNLETFAREVLAVGGTPILVSSLTRRTFSGGSVVQNLQEHRLLTIAAAEAVGVGYIDLNLASTAYVNAIGQEASQAYNLAATDRTHLNEWGGVVFARMVSDLLLVEVPELEEYTKANVTLSGLIREGVPA